MTPKARSAVLVAVALTVLAAGSTPAKKPRSFSHRSHVKNPKTAKCKSCHTEGTAADVERPAKESHAICDAEGCHAEEFFTAKKSETDLCLTCHISSEWKELEKKRANIRAFPRGKDRALQKDDEDRTYLDDWDFYAEYSHKQHLGEGGPVKEKVKDDGCLFCHVISVESGKAVVVRPGHEHCTKCHDGSKKKPKTTMSDCNGCHVYRRGEKGQLLATGPIPKRKKGRVTGKFSHEKHRLDRRKKEPVFTSCGVCHDRVVKAETLAEIVTTSGERTMETACKSCHDGKQRSATGKRIFDITGQCTLCHQPSFFEEGDVPASH